MSDITKCDGTGCKLATTCLRTLADNGPYQSWFAVPPMPADGHCYMYIAAEPIRVYYSPSLDAMFTALPNQIDVNWDFVDLGEL